MRPFVLRRLLATLGLGILAPLRFAAAYQEAPMLADRVQAGKLPPVEQRLPERPEVVHPIGEIGVYGGAWRRLAVVPTDLALMDRLGYEPLVRWDASGKRVIPGVAESWDIRDSGRTFAFRLRKGMRWSDGEPFTSGDILFWYRDFLCNKDLNPVVPKWLQVAGRVVDVAAPDPLTVEFRFAEPYGLFLEMLAFHGSPMLMPEHYLRQFHPAHAAPDRLAASLKARGLDQWIQLFALQADNNGNPDLPTLKPFKLTVPLPAARVIAERNPYYWKVDPDGKQLPYIDSIAYTMVQNTEIGNFKAMTGEVDFQERFINSQYYTLFMQGRERGGYRVWRDYDPVSSVVYINQYSKDDELRPLLQDRRFRIALSVAINRPELIDLVYAGLAEPSRGVSSKYDTYYFPEIDQKYIDYDPELANRLLDKLGMTRGRNGMRRMPDGKPFKQIMHCHPSELGTSMDQWQLISDYWREIGLDFIVKQDAAALSVLQVSNGNSDFWAYAVAGMQWAVDPLWYVPWANTSYFAPLYGRYVASGGKSGVKPPAEFQRLVDWYLELRSITDNEPRKLELGRQILKQWTEECYTIGVVHQQQLTIVSKRFHNVPDEIIQDYRLMTPGYIGIEQFYMTQE
ncbi:MAG: ABC transporter substrate-binding protein [Candidatus Hydrogenedentes bacterium]|nr:ABC transporter substrate-binding protein [Candidatus Hydrogenedentota bacterium]